MSTIVRITNAAALRKAAEAAKIQFTTFSQQKHLSGRLVLHSRRRRNAIKDLPKSPRVAQAQRDIKQLRKLIEKWASKNSDHHHKQSIKIDKERRAAEQAILFTTPARALAAVKAYEALK